MLLFDGFLQGVRTSGIKHAETVLGEADIAGIGLGKVTNE
jgi:hypothetical protein